MTNQPSTLNRSSGSKEDHSCVYAHLIVSLVWVMNVETLWAHDELLDFVRDGMSQARANIRTIQATIRIEENKRAASTGDDEPSGTPSEVQWWQDGDRVRYRAILPQINRVDERLWSAGVRKCLLRPLTPVPKATLSGVVGKSSDFYEDILNLWTATLFEMPLLRSHPSMSHLLERAEILSVRTDVVNGKKLYVVDFELREQYPDRRGTLYIDPAQNFLVAKLVFYRKPRPPVVTGDYHVEVVESRETAPGVFFPTKLASYQVSASERREQFTVTISKLAINQPMSSDVFTLTFPAGTSVANHMTGAVYLTGPYESPATQLEPLTKATMEEFQPGQYYQTGDARNVNKTSWVRVLQMSTVGLLVLMLGSWVYIRMRRPQM